MNLAGGKEIRILEMAEKVLEYTGGKAGIKEAPARVWDTKKRLLASIDKANGLLNYQPSMDFDEGLKLTVQWFRDNWDSIERDAEFPRGMSSAAQGTVSK
jgi:nucleoside-diphosphate-sugar epimerase